jgi:hypothetical protein
VAAEPLGELALLARFWPQLEPRPASKSPMSPDQNCLIPTLAHAAGTYLKLPNVIAARGLLVGAQ